MSAGKCKVLITHPDVPKIALDLLSKSCELIINSELNPTKDSILAKIPGVSGMLWTTTLGLDKDIINAADQLRVVSTISAGTDHVDIRELKARGIKLGHTPRIADEAVADAAILLILAASRRMLEGRQHIERETWTFSVQWMMGQDMRDATVGIVGLGAIGQAIARRLKVFNIERIIYTGHSEKPEAKDLGAEFVTFDYLLCNSDIVVVACPLTPETRLMFSDDAFGKMKNTAVFVNIGRGAVVDQPALIKALENGTIFAAGLDVMTPEPLPSDHKLLKLPNCILTPHVASATFKTRCDMALLAAKNILAGLDGEDLPAPVF